MVFGVYSCLFYLQKVIYDIMLFIKQENHPEIK